MKSKNGVQGSIQPSPPSEVPNIAERSREIANLVLSGLQKGVRKEYEESMPSIINRTIDTTSPNANQTMQCVKLKAEGYSMAEISKITNMTIHQVRIRIEDFKQSYQRLQEAEEREELLVQSVSPR